MAKQILWDCKSKFDSTTCNPNQKCNNKTCQCACKSYRKCGKDYIWNPSACICENNKYLKSIDDTSVIACDDILWVMHIVLTKVTITIATDISINCHTKKVRYKIDAIFCMQFY